MFTASFHEWKFRKRPRIAGKTGDQHIEAMSKVCDERRGDAFAAAQEVGTDNLCEIIDGGPSSINTLISLMREMVFPWLSTSPKNYLTSIAALEADAYRAHNDPVNPASEVDEEALDCEGGKKYDMFSFFFF